MWRNDVVYLHSKILCKELEWFLEWGAGIGGNGCEARSSPVSQW